MDRHATTRALVAKDANLPKKPVVITKAMMFLEQPLIVDENECNKVTTRELKARLRREGLRTAMRSITNEADGLPASNADKASEYKVTEL